MYLCNPDYLIEWRHKEPPRYKKDFVGGMVRVTDFDRFRPSGPHMPPDGAVCEIMRRSTGYSGGELLVQWRCPACGHAHEHIVPEAGLNSGNIHFVEPVGLADYTQALDEERPPMLYLAAPYSHCDQARRDERVDIINRCAAWLMRGGWSVASPLSMGHAICMADPGLDADFAAWREPCLRMLEMSDALVVFLLDGARESVGVAAEIDHARKLGIPLNQVRPLWSKTQDVEGFEVVPDPKWWR